MYRRFNILASVEAQDDQTEKWILEFLLIFQWNLKVWLNIITVIIMFLACYMFGNNSSDPNWWSV